MFWCFFHCPLFTFCSKQITTHTLVHLLYLTVAVILDLVGIPVSNGHLRVRGTTSVFGLEGSGNGEAGVAVRGLGLSPSGVTAAWPSQGDDEDGDVIPGTQLVVWETPATVPGDSPGPQDQSLGQSCIPARSTCVYSCTNTYTRRQIGPYVGLRALFPFAPSPGLPPTCWDHWAHRLTAPCPQWQLPQSHWSHPTSHLFPGPAHHLDSAHTVSGRTLVPGRQRKRTEVLRRKGGWR